MNTQITFHNMKPSPALAERVHRYADRLERYFPRIGGCRVLVELPHRHQRRGKQFRVRIDLAAPGGELIVGREPDPDPLVAIRDAFRAARRELKDHVHRWEAAKRPRAGMRHGWSRHLPSVV